MTSKNRTGAVSVGDRDRKGGGWWKWLLALLLLVGAIILLIALLAGDDDDTAGSTSPKTTQTAPAANDDAPGTTTADGGTLTADGQSLLPVPNDLAGRVGQSAEGRDVVVQKVSGQQGFWIGPSADERVYVEYGAKAGGTEEGAEFKPQVGEKVNLTGEIRPAPAEPGRVLKIAGADEQLVKDQGAYINANTVQSAG